MKRSMKFHLGWMVVAMIVAVSAIAQDKEPAKAPTQSAAKKETAKSSTGKMSDEEAAIRKSVASYIDAFHRRDAKAVASHWSPQAEYVNAESGERVHGRDAIEKQFTRMFGEEGAARLEVSVRSVRFVTPEVAILEGDANVTRPGEAPSESTILAVHVKRDGEWLLDSVRETDLPSRSTSYEHLADLEWMIGKWVDQDEDATVEFNCQWARNKNFLTRSFRVVIGENIDLEGTQVIGWDPAQECVRSWMFDSDGGFADGVWTYKKDHWVIEVAATLPDGRRGSSVNLMTPLDRDSFTWQITGREVDGEIMPNIPAVKIVRVKESE